MMRVLVFPPVNYYRRFLIHKLVEDQFPSLTTFSIGGGEARRPVVCYKSDYIQPQITKPKISDETSNERVPKPSETCPVQPKRERRSYAMPSITIYRPPAARKLEDQTSSNQEREPINESINGKHDQKCPSELEESSQTPKKTDSSGIFMFRNAISSIRTQNQIPKCKSADPVKKTKSTVKSPQVRLRRPDMKVYVPKARRMLIDQQKPSMEESAVQSEVSSVKNNEKPKKNVVPCETNSVKNGEQPKKNVPSQTNSVKNGEQPKKNVPSQTNSVKNGEQPKKNVPNQTNSVKNGEQPKKNVPRETNSARNSEQPKKNVPRQTNSAKNIEQPKKNVIPSETNSAKNIEQTKKNVIPSETNSARNGEQPKKPAVQSDNKDTKNSELQKKPIQTEFYSEEPKVTREHCENLESDKRQCPSSVCIRNTGVSESRTVKFEAKRVYPVSPTSLWIEAQNEVEEVVVKKVSSPLPVETSGNNCSDNDMSKSSLEKMFDKTAITEDSLQLNPEECDWESMFDDSGECLDPTLMEQLSSAVGAVTIEKPKSNYDTFRTKTLDFVGDEFPHVIEIYNFPPEFCHQDLVIVFSQFKNAGFEIKWVDDTHALGIFSNAQIVSEVLALRHPFVKTRLLKDGTMLSKAKARRFAEHLLPYKPRPDTCPALARRLVTGALGVRLPTSREEREAERKILSEAREKKRQEAKQREEAWEGTFH